MPSGAEKGEEAGRPLDRAEILRWLRETDEGRLGELWRRTDSVRRACVGDAVHLRGLVEFSNHCARRCAYCGLASDRPGVYRYRMTADEVLACAQQAVGFGYGALVLQSGEDYGATARWVADLVRRIKRETPLAVTLSLGERTEEELALWREAGADRYLLRFETANRALYDRIHPPLPGRESDRFALLRRLGELGYEVGSGIMVGLPGQSWDDLATDILTFRELDLDMIGLGPYIPHPDTALGRTAAGEGPGLLPADQQVPNDEGTTLKALALTRLACPYVNLPSTTALATIGRERGRERGLRSGANVIMPNLTPLRYREAYEIYPGKAGRHEAAESCHEALMDQIAAIGRTVGQGRGDSPARARREPAGTAAPWNRRRRDR